MAKKSSKAKRTTKKAAKPNKKAKTSSKKSQNTRKAAAPVKAATKRSKVQKNEEPSAFNQILEKARTLFQTQSKDDSMDIIDIILEDHKPLKELIETLKDSEAEFEDKQPAFEQFAILLTSHAKPEEQALYTYMKQDDELRSEGLEGDTEHALADQLIEEVKRTDDQDEWMAKVKVLGELVEHHIKEEESELLPDFKDNSDEEDRMELGRLYLDLRGKMLAQGGDDAPSEVMMDERGVVEGTEDIDDEEMNAAPAAKKKSEKSDRRQANR